MQSGDVRVEFRAMGRDEIVSSTIKVKPRTGWQWSPGDGITLAQGGMSWPFGYAAIGTVCRPGQACPGGWVVQPQSGFGHGNGYLRLRIDEGPNTGAWFVTDVGMNLHAVAILNPDYLPGGTEYPATGADAEACGAPGSATVMIGFIDYNELCRNQSMIPFETWAWEHETQHMVNASDYVAQSFWDPRKRLEGIVAVSADGLDALVQAELENLPMCVQRAAATHDHLGYFRGIPTVTWFWQGASFYSLPQGSTWWYGNPNDPNPYASPC